MASEVIDPAPFAWTDQNWRGPTLLGQIIYEMHIGTFTPEGTWLSAARQLPELAAAGIGSIEMMPVADFPGGFGWGYDGVDLFAPTRLYGRPNDLRHFIDAARAGDRRF
jgi:maltooligosyltrehalose trehalohydrolase